MRGVRLLCLVMNILFMVVYGELQLVKAGEDARFYSKSIDYDKHMELSPKLNHSLCKY